jgi:hypothetical protein
VLMFGGVVAYLWLAIALIQLMRRVRWEKLGRGR